METVFCSKCGYVFGRGEGVVDASTMKITLKKPEACPRCGAHPVKVTTAFTDVSDEEIREILNPHSPGVVRVNIGEYEDASGAIRRSIYKEQLRDLGVGYDGKRWLARVIPAMIVCGLAVGGAAYYARGQWLWALAAGFFGAIFGGAIFDWIVTRFSD